MGNENVWKIGPSMRRIQIALQHITHTTSEYPNTYQDNESLQAMNVNFQHWTLTEKDTFFACLSQRTFADLKPTEPDDEECVPYEEVEYPTSAWPRDVGDHERSAREILKWFKELQYRKVSLDGCGFSWADGGSSWAPQDKLEYEELYGYSREPPSVPWFLWSIYETDAKPHQVYYAWHGDEGREGVILRSELYIVTRCMKARMATSTFCAYNVPVLLLSTHGCKARIIIAHFDVDTMQLNVKCSPFEQFNGFGQEEDETGHLTGGHPRPADFEAKRDLFFRWVNPVCQGSTFLKDSMNAPEMVLRGPKGRKRLVPSASLPDSDPVSDSSEPVD